MKGQVLLTFDIEEFDMPLEYGQEISLSEQMEITNQGLGVLIPLLQLHEISCTMFITANYAIYFPMAIKMLAQQHEIASHAFYHSSFVNADLLESKKTLELLSGQNITGLRMPRMKKIDIKEIVNAGYGYDSSINPTWVPGRYNNFNLPRTFYKEESVIRIPVSVSRGLRLPLFWLGFKNYPYTFFRKLCFKCLRSDGYLCLYFHPWEFTNITKYTLPWYVKKNNGKLLLDRLNRLITDLKKDFEFSSIHEFLDKIYLKQ